MRITEALRLVPIEKDGSVKSALELPTITAGTLAMTATWYKRVGFVPPWIGYLAFDGDRCVGMCAFKTAPIDGAVEIAYGTLPPHEGKGYATQIVRQLIELSHTTAPEIQVFAQTLPQPSASTSILKKLGFVKTAEIQHPEDGLVWEWHLGPR